MEECLETVVETTPDMPTNTPDVETEAQPSVNEESVSVEGFATLQQEFPEVQSLEQVPERVLQIAREQNVSLFDAYLRHRFYEQQAIAAEEARRERTAACAVGSLQTGALRAAPVSDAFARAFEKALS